jgi:hypothetical protein
LPEDRSTEETAKREPSLSAPDFEAVLRSVEPSVRLLSERRLLKVIVYLRDHDRAIPLNPDLPLWVSREDLLASDVVPESVYEGESPRVLLITDVNDRMLEGRPREEQLRAYWPLLFQSAVMAEVDRKVAAGQLTEDQCALRLSRFGARPAREIEFVLKSDHEADPEADAISLYRAFAAVYLAAVSFSPRSVDDLFPSLPDPSIVVELLSRDFDVAGLLARTRPPGVPDPEPAPAPEDWYTSDDGLPVDPAVPESVDVHLSGVMNRASEAEQKGNVVRAAILRTQASRKAEGDAGERAAMAARTAIGRLVENLGDVLDWDEPTRREWRQALAPKLAPAAGGIWPRAARCLYELQKIPADLAQDVYAIDLVEYLRTFGRRQVKRPLPLARDVMLLVHVRAAHRQLLRCRLAEPAQLRLDRLFRHEMHRAEHRVRDALGPILLRALDECGLHPASRVETVARDKVVAELLDRICERGFLRFGDLRDAIARNQLKMPDVAGPEEFLRGDVLLRIDTRLAQDLDGVYRRGEFYLRWLQRSSSLFFGTPGGRWLTLYLIAPFLAAFLTLMALEELRHLGGKVLNFTSQILAPTATASEPALAWDNETQQWVWFDSKEASDLAEQVVTSSGEHHGSFLTAWPAVFGLGVFLLLMFHVPPFRRAVFRLFHEGGRLLRLVFWEWPQAVWRSEVIRAVRYSPVVRFVSRHLIGAVVFTGVIVFFLWFLGAPAELRLRWGGSILAVAIIAFNTPWGRMVQERLAESLADWWRVVRVNLLPGLVATLIDWFRRLANWLEQRLYAVDEWLRFRGGESRGSLALKAFLGLLWFPIAYISRFAFYLLIEPQINPVKHFPVVTVSHKVILPMTPSLADAINVSEATAAGILGCIPGIFGFIAWELMANWRLYRANRPARLKPVMIGSHGETIRGLLRPGFHSGTVPKLFRKIRKEVRREDWYRAGRHHHELEHVKEGVERFVERDLIAILEQSSSWSGQHLEIIDVRFGCQSILVEMIAPGLGGGHFAMAFENRGGKVGAEIVAVGWFDRLATPQKAAFVRALRGLLDKSAAELMDDLERHPAPAGGIGQDTDLTRLTTTYTWEDWVEQWEAEPERTKK